MSRSLTVSNTGRYLQRPDGTPFFYLADTAWELFHRLSREQSVVYLKDRAAKGFTAIQAVVIAELDGLNTPNPAGHRPLIDNDPTKPNEPYFVDVDYIVDQAAALGLFIAMLPTWGDKWQQARTDNKSPIFTPANARVYGRWLGKRYADKPIIWVLGGDRAINTPGERDVICAMAQGIRKGDAGRHLITFHPTGQYSSAYWFHDEPWLDFNMVQTGHTRDRDNYNSIAAEFGRLPIKPVLDGEPGYENHGHAFDPNNGRMDAHQSRKFCYWSLFAGACGHTYGCHDVWQMRYTGGDGYVNTDAPWDKAIHFPGAAQMGYARQLIEQGGYWDRIPDPSLVSPPNIDGPDHVQACRAPDGRYALIYIPTGKPTTLRLFTLCAKTLEAEWFDPRWNKRQPAGAFEVGPWMNHTFTPPYSHDWVLILKRVENR